MSSDVGQHTTRLVVRDLGDGTVRYYPAAAYRDKEKPYTDPRVVVDHRPFSPHWRVWWTPGVPVFAHKEYASHHKARAHVLALRLQGYAVPLKWLHEAPRTG